MVIIHPYLNASFNPEIFLLKEDLPDIKIGINTFVDWFKECSNK
jgi:hypothetical protein